MRKAKRQHSGPANEFETLEELFRADGVDTSQIGFYDSAAFLAKEKAKPAYLENYARWVIVRPRSEEYDARARRIIPKLTELVADALSTDGMQGSCVAASGMISRMLDRLGIWSFGVAGCLTLEVESKNLWRGLATIDDPDFPGATLGHSWVIAPPFTVIDAAISLQRWGNDPIREFIPHFFVATSGGVITKPLVSDVISAQVRTKLAARGHSGADLHYKVEPRLRQFGKTFPTLQFEHGLLLLRYVPVAIRQTDCPLEEINTKGKVGRSGSKIWNEIRPQLTDLMA